MILETQGATKGFIHTSDCPNSLIIWWHMPLLFSFPFLIHASYLVAFAVAFKSREDHRKQLELEEARKAGLAPAELDEDGKEINPHIPQYMSSAPWYLNAERPVSCITFLIPNYSLLLSTFYAD